MRISISFTPSRFVAFSKINKHTVQGMIYSLLQNTDFSIMHEERGFKYFTFSDIFPSGDFFPGKERKLLISSPNPKFIQALYGEIKKKKKIYLSNESFDIKGVKTFKLPLSQDFITGSPVVLYKDNRTGEYFSFRREGDVPAFLRRVAENALKKYNQYYDEKLVLDGPIFDEVIFRKEVAVKLSRQGKEFILIGSMWYDLAKLMYRKGERKFYNFIMDCGIGEKNSLGFGFLNPKDGM